MSSQRQGSSRTGLFQRLSNICILTLAVVLGPVLFLLVTLIIEGRDPGYDPIRDAISLLVYGPHGWVQTMFFVILGIVLVVFALRLYTDVSRDASSRIGVILLVLVGVCFLIVGIFPTDLRNTNPETLPGFIHGLASRAIPLLFTVSSFLFGASFRATPRWRKYSTYTIATGALLLLLVAAFRTGDSHSLWMGLYERMLLVVGLAWIEVIAVRLLFRCLHGTKSQP